MSIARTTLDIPVRIGRQLASHPLKTGGAVLAADLLSKSAVRTLPQRAEYCIARGSLCIQHLQNDKGVFGTHFEWNTAMKLSFAATTLCLAGLFLKVKSKLSKLAMALIIEGSVSNGIDRFAWGHVTDFIRLGPWYPFNLADAAITTGCTLIIYEALAGMKKHN